MRRSAITSAVEVANTLAITVKVGTGEGTVILSDEAGGHENSGIAVVKGLDDEIELLIY